MDCNEWGLIKTGWVAPFHFDSKAKNQLFVEIESYFSSKDAVDNFIKGLESSVEVYIASKDTSTDMDEKGKVEAKLKRVITGLTKSINAFSELDGYAQATYSQHSFYAEKELIGGSPTNRWNADPTRELEILLLAAKNHLNEVKEVKYSRKHTTKYLVRDVVRKWRKYASNGRLISSVQFAWRDIDRGIISPEVTLLETVKIVLENAGAPTKDPGDSINEAIDWCKQSDEGRLNWWGEVEK